MITTLLCALVGLGGTQAAMAQEPAPTTCEAGDVYGGCPGFIVTPPEVSEGGIISISGQGCAPFQEVIFSINGQVIGQTTTNEVGVFTAQLQLPANLGPGTYTIIGTCGTTTMSSSLTIRAATTTTARVTTGGGSLPQTGSDTTVMLVRGALVLLCLGGLVLVASKRRHGANVDS